MIVQIRARQWPLLLAAAVLLLAVMLPTVHPAGAQGAVVVTRDQARVTFPDGIEFSLAAESAAPITRVELLYRTRGGETWNLSVPEVSEANAIELTETIDLRQDYLPPGVDLEYHWRLEFENGDSFQTENRPLAWVDSRFDWTLTERGPIRLHTYRLDEAARERIVSVAQRTAERIAAEYGIERLSPIRLWTYASTEDFAGAQAPNSEPWIGGTAYVDLGLVLLVVPNDDLDQIERVVPHEVAHQVIHQLTDNPFAPLPKWLDEGLAVSYEEVHDPSFPILLEQAASDRLPTLRSLNAAFPYDSAAATLAYAQSHSIVEFIADHYGEAELRELVTTFADGVTADQAVGAALGVSIEELDSAWRDEVTAQAADGPFAAGRSDGSPGIDTGLAISIASGAAIMAAVALLSLIVGGIMMVRRGRLPDDDDDSLPPADYLPASRNGSKPPGAAGPSMTAW